MSAKPEPTDYNEDGICHACAAGDHEHCYGYGCECAVETEEPIR